MPALYRCTKCGRWTSRVTKLCDLCDDDEILIHCQRGGLVDAPSSNLGDGNIMRVRLPPLVPLQ